MKRKRNAFQRHFNRLSWQVKAGILTLILLPLLPFIVLSCAIVGIAEEVRTWPRTFKREVWSERGW